MLQKKTELPKCPRCKSNEFVKEAKGCRCLSCPPWYCENQDCKWKTPSNRLISYEFWEDDEDE